MLDAKLLRTDLDSVARNLARRGFTLDVEHFRALEERRKATQVAADEIRAARNAHAKKVGMAKGKGEDITALLAEGEALARKLEGLDYEQAAVQAEFDAIILGLPNLLHDSVPDGRDESANVEVRRWGTPREFDFTPLDHVAIGGKLALVDFESAGRISGARFVVLKGGVARLQRALIQYMLDLHTSQHGYTEVYAPYLVSRQSLVGTGQLPKFEADLFRVVGGESEYFLIPTAEVPVTNLVRDAILEANTLPRRYVAHTPCFRSEAGSYGKDTRGMIRQHQFEKVELVHMVRPEDSYAALEELTGHAEAVLQGLGLPYRVVALCAGDVGFGGAEADVTGAERHHAIRQVEALQDLLGIADEQLELGVRVLGLHDVHQFDLLELVLADHAARVLAVGTGFAAEARRVRSVAARQRAGLEDRFPREVRDRHFGGRDQEKLDVA